MSKRIRNVIFGPRSALPTSAACVVANGVRETLAALLGAPVEVRLFEPAIPGASAWPAILHDAVLYRVPGAVANAAIVLRSPDALALTTALFGERLERQPARRLSPVECDVLDRVVRAIAAHLGSVCGARETHAVERIEAAETFATYFELLLEEPAGVRIGVALSRDPSPEPRTCFDISHLADVPLCVRALLDLGAISSGAVATMRHGMLLPIHPSALHRCTLALHGRPLARGGCGVQNGRHAFTVASTVAS
jgi:hypothetical protein